MANDFLDKKQDAQDKLSAEKAKGQKLEQLQLKQAELEVEGKQVSVDKDKAALKNIQADTISKGVDNTVKKTDAIVKVQETDSSRSDKNYENFKKFVMGDPDSAKPNTYDESRNLLARKSGQPIVSTSGGSPMGGSPMSGTQTMSGIQVGGGVQQALPPQPKSYSPPPTSPLPTSSPPPRLRGPHQPRPIDYKKTEIVERRENPYDDAYAERLKEVSEQRKENSELTKEIHKNYQEANDNYKGKMEKLHNDMKELKENTPSYKKAVNSIPVASKVLAVISAGLAGFAGKENPLAIVDSLIDQAYTDQKLEYDAKIEGFESNKNLYGLLKDQAKEEFDIKTLWIKSINNDLIDSLVTLEKGLDREDQKEDIRHKIAQLKETQGAIDENTKAKIEREELDKADLKNERAIVRSQKRQDRIAAQRIARRKEDYNRFKDQRRYELDLFKATNPKAKSGKGPMYFGHKTPVQEIQRANAQGRNVPIENSKVQLLDSKKGLKIVSESEDKARKSTQAFVKLNALISGKGNLNKEERKLHEYIKSSIGDSATQRKGKGIASAWRMFKGKPSERKKAEQALYRLVTTAALGKRYELGGGPVTDSERPILYNLAGLSYTPGGKYDGGKALIKGLWTSINNGTILETAKNASQTTLEDYAAKLRSNAVNLDGSSITTKQSREYAKINLTRR